MTTAPKITSLRYHSLRTPAYHNWLHDYVTNILTEERAALLHMTEVRNFMVSIDAQMEGNSVVEAAYPESAQIEHDTQQIIDETLLLIAATDYFSIDPTVTDAEKTAATAVHAMIGSLRGITQKTQDESIDAVRDVCAMLLQTPANLSAYHQLERVQHMQTLNNERVSLINARDAHKSERRGFNSTYELRTVVDPERVTNYEDLEYIARRGTTAEKAAAAEMIAQINAKHITLAQQLATHQTYLDKKSGEEKPEHKPEHKPDNRPEGVEPNEEGDEPDNGGDSGNTGGDSGNSGGDSGNSGDNNQNPPSGGNNGGSDKPPNPESPD